jgi:hypothetical protein
MSSSARQEKAFVFYLDLGPSRPPSSRKMGGIGNDCRNLEVRRHSADRTIELEPDSLQTYPQAVNTGSQVCNGAET